MLVSAVMDDFKIGSSAVADVDDDGVDDGVEIVGIVAV